MGSRQGWGAPIVPGTRHEMFTIIREVDRIFRYGRVERRVEVRCDCGTLKQLYLAKLPKSCGCSRILNRQAEGMRRAAQDQAGSVAVIRLTKGYCAVVDVEDLPLLAPSQWQASVRRNRQGEIQKIYAQRGGAPGSVIQMHRLILGLPPLGPDCLLDVDHRDGDGLNNRRRNLRVASRRQNNCNKDKPSCAGRGGSQYKGVCFRKNRKNGWIAYIAGVHVGCFSTEEQAARAYDTEAIRLYGEFARINLPLVAENA